MHTYYSIMVFWWSSRLLGQLANGDSGDEDGYFLEKIEIADRPQVVQCPSDDVIIVPYKCHIDGQWVDCNKKHCCVGYTLIAGYCISDDLDPCSLRLCEQKCATYFGRIVCTCFHGYKFDARRRKDGIKPYCLDVDECTEDNGGCQHECENTDGNFRCTCNEGYSLKADNITCLQLEESIANLSVAIQLTNSDIVDSKNCYASCSIVAKLRTRIEILEEKIQTLNTAIKLYSFGAGPPGPEGPPGPMGPRGFPGADGRPLTPLKTELTDSVDSNRKGSKYRNDDDFDDLEDDDEEAIEEHDEPLDTFVSVMQNGEETFCQCTRGPMGFPGAQGRDGPKGEQGDTGTKGEKGDKGNMELLLLMIADLRHDVELLKNSMIRSDEAVVTLEGETNVEG